MGASDVGSLPVRNLGYYYTDWIWRSGSIDFMKSMLLFFDGLALALPADMAAQIIDRDPILATPLAERGLLVNFDPVETLDAKSAKRLVRALTEIIDQSPLRKNRNRDPLNEELVDIHWGSGIANPQAVRMLERALSERGLIFPSAESGIYAIDFEARVLVLTLFAQMLRGQLAPQGINLHLATDSDSIAYDMAVELERYVNRDPYSRRYAPRSLPQALNPLQLTDDLRNVGVDLSRVPLDEILDFREQNGQHYRAYAKGLRELLATLAQAGPAERKEILQERKAEMRDQAVELRRASRAAFGVRITSLLLSLSGAAWTLRTGDPVGAILAGTSAGLQAVSRKHQSVTAYSYLIKAQDFGYNHFEVDRDDDL
jgi:hypothetical protein